MKVGVGVSVGVCAGKGVAVKVSVGGNLSAVWVAAAPAVWAIVVLIEFGSNVGIGAEAGARVGTHASIIAVMTKTTIARLFRRIIFSLKILYFTIIVRYA